MANPTTVGVGKGDSIEITNQGGGTQLRYQHTLITLDRFEREALARALRGNK